MSYYQKDMLSINTRTLLANYLAQIIFSSKTLQPYRQQLAQIQYFDCLSLFRYLDDDKKGYLTYKNLNKILGQTVQEKFLMYGFSRLDSLKVGQLNRLQFCQFLLPRDNNYLRELIAQRIGQPLEISSNNAQLDINSGNSTDTLLQQVQIFSQMMQKIIVQEIGVLSPLRQQLLNKEDYSIKGVMSALDVNRHGFVSSQDLQKFIQGQGISLHEKKNKGSDLFVQIYNSSLNGKLSIEELQWAIQGFQNNKKTRKLSDQRQSYFNKLKSSVKNVQRNLTQRKQRNNNKNSDKKNNTNQNPNKENINKSSQKDKGQNIKSNKKNNSPQKTSINKKQTNNEKSPHEKLNYQEQISFSPENIQSNKQKSQNSHKKSQSLFNQQYTQSLKLYIQRQRLQKITDQKLLQKQHQINKQIDILKIQALQNLRLKIKEESIQKKLLIQDQIKRQKQLQIQRLIQQQKKRLQSLELYRKLEYSQQLKILKQQQRQMQRKVQYDYQFQLQLEKQRKLTFQQEIKKQHLKRQRQLQRQIQIERQRRILHQRALRKQFQIQTKLKNQFQIAQIRKKSELEADMTIKRYFSNGRYDRLQQFQLSIHPHKSPQISFFEKNSVKKSQKRQKSRSANGQIYNTNRKSIQNSQKSQRKTTQNKLRRIDLHPTNFYQQLKTQSPLSSLRYKINNNLQQQLKIEYQNKYQKTFYNKLRDQDLKQHLQKTDLYLQRSKQLRQTIQKQRQLQRQNYSKYFNDSFDGSNCSYSYSYGDNYISSYRSNNSNNKNNFNRKLKLKYDVSQSILEQQNGLDFQKESNTNSGNCNDGNQYNNSKRNNKLPLNIIQKQIKKDQIQYKQQQKGRLISPDGKYQKNYEENNQNTTITKK